MPGFQAAQGTRREQGRVHQCRRSGQDREMKEYIQAAPAFAGISAAALDLLAHGGTWVSLQPGETLFSLGDPSDALYLSVDGSLQVVIPRSPEAEIVIAEMGPAEVV